MMEAKCRILQEQQCIGFPLYMLQLNLLRGLCSALLLSGCNVARMHVNHCEAQLERANYLGTTYTDDDGAHFTWYRDTGKEKLLLLHGYSGTGSLQWHRTAHLLRDRYDCILPDLLSHGQSAAWDTTRQGRSMADQVAHVILILDSLRITGAIGVVGNSYGGGVAAQLAESHPDRIERVVIYDGLVSDYSKAIADSIARSVGSTDMLAVMRTANIKELRRAIRLSLYRNPPLPGCLLKNIQKELMAPYRPAQITLLRDLMAHQDQFLQKRFIWPMPVDLIWGERDELLPNFTGHAIMRRHELPDDRWHTIPRTGHVANLERPKAFDRLLREVLSRP